MTNISYIKTRNAQGAAAFKGIEIAGGYQHKEALKGMGYRFNGFNNTWCKAVEENDAAAEIVDAVIACKLPADEVEKVLGKALDMGYIPENIQIKPETVEKLQKYAQ